MLRGEAIFFPVKETERERKKERVNQQRQSRTEIIDCVTDPVTIKQIAGSYLWFTLYEACMRHSSVYTELTRCFTDHHSAEGSDTLWRSPGRISTRRTLTSETRTWTPHTLNATFWRSLQAAQQESWKSRVPVLNVSLRCRIAMSVFSWED